MFIYDRGLRNLLESIRRLCVQNRYADFTNFLGGICFIDVLPKTANCGNSIIMNGYSCIERPQTAKSACYSVDLNLLLSTSNKIKMPEKVRH